jgi:signal peptidase I
MASKTKPANPFKDITKTVLYAVAIAIGVRTIGYEPFNIPSGSMIPTLLVGDYLFVSKWSYGYSRHSLPFSLPLIPEGVRILAHTPERGDVAVFKLPADGKTDYIKRLVGLPGDRIQMINGILNINGQPVQRERVMDTFEPNGRGSGVRVTEYIETLPNGKRHFIYEQSDQGPNDNTGVYTVPPGHYFAMGDNRDNSQDSRSSEVGFVPFGNLVGRAEFLFFSTDGSAQWWEFWNLPFALRFSRFFNGIN